MSHSVDLGALIEKLFVLEHVAHGSQQYCESHGIDTFESTGYLRPQSPTTLTKSIVSGLTLEIAVRLRVLLDYAYTLDKARTKALEDQATTGLQIAYDQDGNSRLTIRDSLNKIIHAETVVVGLEPLPDDSADVHYWIGQVPVTGNHNGKPWHYTVDIPNWCKAAGRLVNALVAEEKLFGMGSNSAV